MNSIIKNLMKKGIVKGRSEPLSQSEIKELENLILKSKNKYLKMERYLKILLELIKE